MAEEEKEMNSQGLGILFTTRSISARIFNRRNECIASFNDG